MKFEKELLELYGLVLGDGTLRKGSYPQMTFYNYDIELMLYTKKLIEKINKESIKIHKRMKGKGVEYSVSIPSKIRNKLLELGFNKTRIPKWVFESKYKNFLLKGFFESDGTLNNFQITITQKHYKGLLEDCVKIANSLGLSAHVHSSSSNRPDEYYLVIEDLIKVKNLFGKTVKNIPNIKRKVRGYYFTKRKILESSDNKKWLTTSEIRNKLNSLGINLSGKSKILVRKHLNPLWKDGFLDKEKDVTLRDNKGRIIRLDSKWKLSRELSPEEILNFPYGVSHED